MSSEKLSSELIYSLNAEGIFGSIYYSLRLLKIYMMIILIPSLGRRLLSVEKTQQHPRLLKCHAYKHPSSIGNLHMYAGYGVFPL